jgi:hypothetical protein
MDLDEFRKKAKKQVDVGFLRRSDDEIRAVFCKCTTDGSMLSREQLCTALEMLGVHLPQDKDSLEALFLEIDTNKDNRFALDEFMVAVRRQSFLQSWSRTIPWWQIVADSIPGQQGSETDLQLLVNFSDKEVDVICEAISYGVRLELADRVSKLKASYTAIRTREIDQGTSKHKTFKACCGAAAEFHQGLGGRVG